MRGLNKNGNIVELKNKIINFINNDNIKTVNYTKLETYVNSVINIPLEEFLIKYNPSKNHYIKSSSLSKSLNKWSFLKEFKLVPGIYQFELIKGFESYIGSTKDLYKRCYTQHRTQAITYTNKHKLFYNKVRLQGWDSFNLKILYLIPNHVYLFAEKNPNYFITEKDLLILTDLISYELTIAEQLQLDYKKPNLNSSLFANWSSYNTGATGYIRSDELNDELSLSFLNRTFSEYTKNLHRKNNTGKILSDTTKLKISKGAGGITVYLVNVKFNNEIVEFKTKTLLSEELNISIRTINRWLDDNKVHSTKSLKYPQVKLMSCLLV